MPLETEHPIDEKREEQDYLTNLFNFPAHLLLPDQRAVLDKFKFDAVNEYLDKHST